MKRFTRLYREIDRTTRTNEKLEALQRYFRDAPPADAAWGLHFLSGRRPKRAVSGSLLLHCAIEKTGYPEWLIAESRDHVGDTSETLALLLPDTSSATEEPLHEVAQRRLLPLPALPDADKRIVILDTWSVLNAEQRLVFHKLISGTFRVGVARTLVVRALASVAGVPPAVMEHRLLADWQPTAEDFQRLIDGHDTAADPAQPYPFYLAYPLETPQESLGEIGEWQLEWKWDGLRAQVIRRGEHTLVWSRGEELIGTAFPPFPSHSASTTGSQAAPAPRSAPHRSHTASHPSGQIRTSRRRRTPPARTSARARFAASRSAHPQDPRRKPGAPSSQDRPAPTSHRRPSPDRPR